MSICNTEPEDINPDIETEHRGQRMASIIPRRERGRWTLASLAAVAIAVATLSYSAAAPGAVHQPVAPAVAPTSIAPPAPALAPHPAAEPTVQPTAEPRAEQPVAQAAPTVAAEPIRPLAGPVAPPVVNSGPPPARKPGTPDPDPTTDHVIVVDGTSGAVLFQRNAYEPVAPASLTKIMTATLGLEHGSLSDHVRADVDARAMTDSTVMGLEPWFDVTLQDLLYGLMLPSGNDAALAIARYVAGNDASFVKLMNQKAAELGLRCTHFANPHGLDAPNHYSCPADMVTMARYAMQYPVFREVVRARSYDIRESNISYTLHNINPILTAFPGADGVKTGFTDNAGRSLVATAVRDGHRVYVAFMRSSAGAASDGVLLLDWAFNSFTWPEGTGEPDDPPG